jgi:predicted nucleic acid-binding protein
MTATVFLDTNVLAYAALGTGKDAAQVLQEFFVTVVKKAANPLSPQQALEWIEQLTAFPCYPIDHRLVRIAVEKSARYTISYWDAAILSAAQTLGCHTVYSEDLNDGQQYAGVRVVNTFASHFAR